MELGGEADLQRADTLGGGVLAHLGGDAGDRGLRVEEGEREGEAGEGGVEAHAGGEREIGGDSEAALGGELGDGRRAEGAVEVAVEVGEGERREHGPVTLARSARRTPTATSASRAPSRW